MMTARLRLIVATLFVSIPFTVFAVQPRRAASKPAEQPLSINDASAQVKLPAPVDATVIGGSGRFLILHLKKLQVLGVFDVASDKVLKYLPMPTNDLAFTVGQDKLFVGLRDLKQIQRWDLKKLELEASAAAPEGGIGEMAIGASANGPLLMTGNKRYWQIDPNTLQATTFPSKNWGTDGSAWGPVHVHVSFDGSTAVACGGGWAGVELASLIGGVPDEPQAGWSVTGDTLVAGNGQLVFPNGGVVRRDLTSPVMGIEGEAFPADDPAFMLTFKNSTLTLFCNSDPRPLLTQIVPELRDRSKLPIAQRAHLIVSQKQLITLGPGEDELIVRKFDIEEKLAASGTGFLFVESAPVCIATRGADYSYEMKVESKGGGVKTELQAGPPGMKLDGVKLSWPVPANFGDATATVIIQVSDTSGQTTFHTFVIRLSNSAAAVAANAGKNLGNGDIPAAAAQLSAVDELTTFKLSEPFAAFHAGQGGHKLVFFEKAAKKLVVYETATGKQIGTIPVAADDTQFTCGRDSIVVALPALKVLQRYDLNTCQRTKSAAIPDQRPLRKIKMGNDSVGSAFLYFGGELVAVDSNSLATVKYRGSLPAGNPDWWFDYRISADSSTIVAWDPYASPSGYSITRLNNATATSIDSADGFSMANRQFTPTADGSLVLYEMNTYDATGHAVATSVNGYTNLIPTPDPRFLLAIKGGDKKCEAIALCTTNNRSIIAELKNLPDIGNGDPADPRAIYLSTEKILALIPNSNDCFQLAKISPGGAVATASSGKSAPTTAASTVVVSLPPRDVAVNGTFSYQIQVLPENASVKYKIESAPDGLTVSPSGRVTWKPTARPIGGKVSVVLTIIDAAGNELPHAFDINVTRGTATPGDAAANVGEIVKADDHRIELPTGDYRYLQGWAGHTLILSGRQLAIASADGFTIEKRMTLPKSYITIGERKDYYVAISQEPRSIDILDKASLKVLRGRAIAFDTLVDLKLHPTRSIAYVSYTQAGDLPNHHFLIFDEATAEARNDDNWIGQWLEISPDGSFLLTGFQETYQNGNDIIDNPDRIWIVPSYGSIDMMVRYDLDEQTGLPIREAHREKVGGNGVGIRLSLDGKRATYLSHTGYPGNSHNLAGWEPADLNKLPTSYATSGVATTLDLAYHPILPMVASFGKGSVTFFNRETGEKEESRINDDEITGEEIERIYFSPDGKSLILQTTTNSIKYLYHLPLKLTSDEQAIVKSLPRPVKTPLSPNTPARPQTPRKLPEAQARLPEEPNMMEQCSDSASLCRVQLKHQREDNKGAAATVA